MTAAKSGALRVAATGLGLAALAALALASAPALAANVTVTVTNAAGQPLADAVVYAEPASGPQMAKGLAKAEIEQKARKFAPLVSVVQTGAEVSFPNNDTVRHHVYSFSAPKQFDIKLYSGVPGKPVTFDKPGTVVIGCHIHDQMVADVHIVGTPYFGKTDAAGTIKLEGLSNGKYQLKAWHYGLPAGAAPGEQAFTASAAESNASFSLNTRATPVAN